MEHRELQVTPTSCDILLVSVNARFSHCAYAVRSLQANLGRLSESAAILETDLAVTPFQLASQIAELQPRIVSFSLYLWNVRTIETTATLLRTLSPHQRLVAGGPQVTPDYAGAGLFDALIVGEGETAFRTLCERWLTESPASPPAAPRTPPAPLVAEPEDPASLALPYPLYTDADLAHRTVYVESSRGCPCACAYCTSADTGLRLFPLDRLLPAFDALWQRGLRRFKFLDRSFNAPVEHAAAVLDFFLTRVTPDTRLHFEINADFLHERLASRILAFPKGVLHLETGIQTLNPRVAAAVGRRSDTAAALENLRFLTQQTGATVHADLIFGLPGEDEASFACGFNALVATCNPPELQVNQLKILPGTRFARDASRLGLAFNPEPPFEVLFTDAMNFATLVRIQSFARCWELVHNRGRFPGALRLLHAACGGDYYRAYLSLAMRIRHEEGRFFAISLPRLATLLRAHLASEFGVPEADAERAINDDLNGKPT